MTGSSTVGVVVCRVAAVFLFVRATEQLSMVVPQYSQLGGDIDAFFAWSLLMLGAPIGAGLILWFSAERISNAVPDSLSVKLSDTLAVSDLISIGILLLGIHAVFYGIVSAAYTESSFWLESYSQSFPDRLDSWISPLRVRYAIQVALGLTLIVGRARLVAVFSRIRRIGIHDA